MPEKTGQERLAELAHENVIRGVEIFKTGTHNGDPYTEKDLDEMVDSFKVLDFRPALKVGHTKDFPGAPAYGWITNLKRTGDKLYADFESMHDSVVEALRSKAYDRVSSEIYFNLKRGGKEFRRALKAVALLGAEVPAVANLKPLHKMEFADAGFDKLGAFEAALDVSTQAVVEALAQRIGGLVNFTKEYDMKNAAKIKELETQSAEFKAKLEELKKKGTKEDAPEYKQLSEQGAKIEADIKALKAEDDDEEKKNLVASNKEMQVKIASLEADKRRRDIDERLAKVKAPSFKPALQALYALALDKGAEKVKVYSVDKDNKPVTEEKTVPEIVDGIVAEINHQVERLFKAHAVIGGPRRMEDPASDDPGAEVDRLTKEYMLKNAATIKGDYAAAMDIVLQSNPELAKQYSESQGTRN